ncbi:MAG: arsenate reductase ArsC [Candidatus Cloacimonetes bacterium]|nr:arsenate reductase ArsC [Candidatus Cloacimonadota bacterium]MDY0336752.1 arsenate reductase ArsC [Candidatus Cloacimonadaceae bacterium]
MKKVLIICTGNSCRSIMAEALINHYLNAQWQAYSAGTHPSQPHPLALRALHELGIDTGYLKSESISEYWHREDLDLIITVCDNARKNCPAFYKPVKQLHISFPDPVNYRANTDEAAMSGFRKVRDTIIETLLPVLKEYV